MAIVFCGLCITLTVLLLADRLRLGRIIGRLRDDHEQLGDEIWDVQAAVEARRRAEASSDAKSRFLAVLSHEVRTPLNGILGLTDLLAGTTLDREQQAYVEAVKTSGLALTTLIDEILDFSRIEAGRLDFETAPFDLGALVEGVVELLAPRAQGKGLEIASWLDPAVPRQVIGDPVRLRQVLTNLAGNAVKFTECGGVGVSVRRGAAGRILFEVADTGPGVPLAHRSSIFEDFEQGDGSMTRRHGGTGLGLAISKRIVEGMHGTIAVSERSDGGAIFSFALDLPVVEHTTETTPASWPDLRGQRVLIAAKSPFQAPFLAERFRAAGAEAMVVSDAAQALQQLETGTGADLLFVDCGLGPAATEQLAAAARRRAVSSAVLLFSPFERRAFGQTLAAGYDGWLVKPVRSASLAARVGSRPALGRPGDAVGPIPAPTVRPSLRVLLAEDNEINTLVAMSFLGRLGAQVVHAGDGTAALALALAALRGESPAFDLVLLDVSMPGLDGLDVARRIRAAEAEAGLRPIRIVALTAHAFSDDRSDAERAGIDQVLVKPIAYADLDLALRRPAVLRPAG